MAASWLLTDERQRLWVGWAGDRPVGAAAAFVAAGITDVTLVATVPEARRRGYGAALTWQATLADPALPALLLATAEGQAVYERWATWRSSASRSGRGTAPDA